MAAETPPENRCSVLIVDDEEGPRQALEFVLRPHFRVLAASSGEEAIEILRRERVDVVTLDLSMPGIDGLATLTRIREIIPEMAVVIVTAKGTLDNAKEAVRLRAFDFIQKPFSAATVLEVINKAGESASTRSAFLTNMGHELRTSLTVLVGYSSMVAEQAAERSGGANLPAVDAMERASGRLMSTVRSMIDLSMIEAGSFTIEPVSVDLAALVEKETGELTRLAQKKNLSLRLEIAERGRCVRFDAYCLANAFRAILDNAIKFTREGGVVVKLHRHGNQPAVRGSRNRSGAGQAARREKRRLAFVREREGAGIDLSHPSATDSRAGRRGEHCRLSRALRAEAGCRSNGGVSAVSGLGRGRRLVSRASRLWKKGAGDARRPLGSGAHDS
jgi:signal transduction histidine kinase